MDKSILEKFEELKKYDTPSISNVVATYPDDHELCLGLYNPWECNWYTDESIHCMLPELGRTVGFAVTAKVGIPDPSFDRLSNSDIFRAVADCPYPCIIVLEMDMPEKYRIKNRVAGGNLTTALKALGGVGLITNGPIGDMDEIRGMDFQYLATGLTVGHGNQAVKAVNVPVSVCSMDVMPGEIIHMDEHGAVKFPANKLDEVLELAAKLNDVETLRMKEVSECKDVDRIINLTMGFEGVK